MSRMISRATSIWFGIALWKRVFAGLVIGVLVGLMTPEFAAALSPIGEFFLRSIRLLVVPLVFATLVTGLVSIGDVRRLGSLGVRTLGFYVATTCAATLIGLAGGASIRPGDGASLSASQTADAAPPATSPDWTARLLDVVPTNPVAALAEGNMLQIISLAMLTGTGILMAGRRGRPLAWGCASLGEVMIQVTRIVMELAPIGVLALIATAVADNGLATMGALVKLVGGYYVCCLLHMVIVYGLVLRIVLRLPIAPFVRGVADAQSVAASTTSSSATLPVTMVCAQENLGVGRSTASFVLPLGATVNMDGTGVYLGVIAMFAAQAAGIELGAAELITVLVTATLASIGAAGVPGGSLLMVTTVLTALDLPLEVFALVASVDRLVDIARTVVNVTGDALAAVYVSRREGDFDQLKYRADATA